MKPQFYTITKRGNFYWIDYFRENAMLCSPVENNLLCHETGRSLIEMKHPFAMDYIVMSYLLDLVSKGLFPLKYIDIVKNTLIDILNNRILFNN